MITSYKNEEHKFKTAEACRAFCRVHPAFSITTAGDAGYVAIHKHGLYSIIGATSMLNDVSGCSVPSSLQDQLTETIHDCELSYKNMFTAGLLGSLTGAKFKMGGNGMSHPIILTIALAMEAPFMVMYSLLLAAFFMLVGGGINSFSVFLLCSTYVLVEFLIPWINSYYYDPIEEPWMIPNHLRENGCWN